MRILLYKTESEKNRLQKVLTNEVELVGALKDSSSVHTPAVLIQSKPIGFNYAYIPEWGRYYYINNITAYRANAYLINLKVDVLMTYAAEIRNLSGIVSRLNTGSAYASRDVVRDVREDSRKISWDYTFEGKEAYILIAQGGRQVSS